MHPADGADDLLIGSPVRDVGGLSNAGAAVIAFGQAGTGLVAADSLLWNRSDLEVVGNRAAGDQYCSAVLLEDFDGDGRADAVITSPNRTAAGVDDAGDVVVIYSRSNDLFSDHSKPLPKTSSGAVAVGVADSFKALWRQAARFGHDPEADQDLVGDSQLTSGHAERLHSEVALAQTELPGGHDPVV